MNITTHPLTLQLRNSYNLQRLFLIFYGWFTETVGLDIVTLMHQRWRQLSPHTVQYSARTDRGCRMCREAAVHMLDLKALISLEKGTEVKYFVNNTTCLHSGVEHWDCCISPGPKSGSIVQYFHEGRGLRLSVWPDRNIHQTLGFIL